MTRIQRHNSAILSPVTVRRIAVTICNLIATRSRPLLATALLPAHDPRRVALVGCLRATRQAFWRTGDRRQRAGAVISPDGQYAVFLADKDTDGKNELYSVTLTSGLVITKISGTLSSRVATSIASSSARTAHGLSFRAT